MAHSTQSTDDIGNNGSFLEYNAFFFTHRVYCARLVFVCCLPAWLPDCLIACSFDSSLAYWMRWWFENWCNSIPFITFSTYNMVIVVSSFSTLCGNNQIWFDFWPMVFAELFIFSCSSLAKSHYCWAKTVNCRSLKWYKFPHQTEFMHARKSNSSRGSMWSIFLWSSFFLLKFSGNFVLLLKL